MKEHLLRFSTFLFLSFFITHICAQAYLHMEGAGIVDGNGNEVVIEGNCWGNNYNGLPAVK